MNRHNIPVEVKAVIDEAIAVGVIDPAEVYVMAVRYGDNWSSLIDGITDIAMRLHSKEGRASYYRIVDKAKAFWIKT